MIRFTPLLPLLFTAFFLSLPLGAREPAATPTPAPGATATATAAAGPEAEEPPAADSGTEALNRGRRDWPEDAKVFLIPVRQQIMHPQLFLVRRGVAQAKQEKADAIVFLMDTPGGRIDLMREIVNTIIDLDIPTYTLVEKDALSAGAIIALSTDFIYMRPRSVIGDAMPVMMGAQGYEELGENEREKVESAMDAIVRGIAQAKGRDEMLIRAMVRRGLEYTLSDGTVISSEGEILTLTNQEAEQTTPEDEPLLSEGTVDDLDNMLNRVGLGDAERVELVTTWADDLAVLITKVAPLLMTLALVLFYMEIQSPGVGWPGALGLTFFLIVMFGHNVAGLAGMGDLVLIALGLALILVEVLVIPGFGFTGVSGIVLLIWGMTRAMIYRYPGDPGELPGLDNFGNVGEAVTNVGLSVIGSFVLMALLLRGLGSSAWGKKLVLAEAISSTGQDPERIRLTAMIGVSGRAVTPLTPSGTIDIDGVEFDAVSDGGYIDRGTPVDVVEVRNHRLIVSDYRAPPKTS